MPLRTPAISLGSSRARASAWARRPVPTLLLSVAAWSLALHLVALIGTTLVHPRAHADGSSLTSAWQHWDAGWFHQITAHGYHYAATTPGKHKCLPHHPCLYLQSAFYPGYPLLARFLYELTHPFGLSVTGAMLLTNQLLVFVLAWLLCSFATTLTTDPLVGLQTVRYLLLFP